MDNTPPVIEKLQAIANSFRAASSAPLNAVAVTFTARDSATSIERAQYSVDGGEWILCAPVTHISDAPEEHYDFTIAAVSPGEHTVAVRAYDRFENVGSAKTVVTIK